VGEPALGKKPGDVPIEKHGIRRSAGAGGVRGRHSRQGAKAERRGRGVQPLTDSMPQFLSEKRGHRAACDSSPEIKLSQARHAAKKEPS